VICFKKQKREAAIRVTEMKASYDKFMETAHRQEDEQDCLASIRRR
jgi:hypothetical protein